MSFLQFVLFGVPPSSSAEGGTRIPAGFTTPPRAGCLRGVCGPCGFPEKH